MKMQFIFFGAVVILLSACSKKTADTPIATVPERLEITPESESVTIGGTAAFEVVYYNTSGDIAPAPAGIVWSTDDEAIATVNAQGEATGISAGQAEIQASYKNITATALFTVVPNNNAVASVTINPTEKELKLNEVFLLTALAKDIDGNTIAGKIFTWETDAPAYAAINTATGDVTATGYGTANITATTDGIKGSPVMIQVIRSGNFGQMSSTGSAKLKIENGLLKLQTSADFSVASGPPDLRIYLGNNSDNINGAEEIASLNDRSGAQSWNVQTSVSITQYRYVIVWCKQFGGTYGVADLGN